MGGKRFGRRHEKYLFSPPLKTSWGPDLSVLGAPYRWSHGTIGDCEQSRRHCEIKDSKMIQFKINRYQRVGPTPLTCQHLAWLRNQTLHLKEQMTPLISPVRAWLHGKHMWECCPRLTTRDEPHSVNWNRHKQNWYIDLAKPKSQASVYILLIYSNNKR